LILNDLRLTYPSNPRSRVKLGFLADFLSRTVLIGFLTGVGFQVGIAVLSDMLKLEVHGTNPVKQLLQAVRQLPQANIPTLCLSAGVVALVLLSRRFMPRFPGALLAVVGRWRQAQPFISRYTESRWSVPSQADCLIFLPGPLNWRLVHDLLPVAGSCFVMIVAQSSVTARAYAAKHHQTLDENRDLLGISAANAAAALSRTFVVNGSPTQTAMVETSGGSS
jgi:sulfate permease, SulP family